MKRWFGLLAALICAVNCSSARQYKQPDAQGGSTSFGGSAVAAGGGMARGGAGTSGEAGGPMAPEGGSGEPVSNGGNDPGPNSGAGEGAAPPDAGGGNTPSGCATLACQHGECVEADGGARCDCKEGYQGRLCETDRDDCAGNTCKNQSTCVDQVGGYVCRCPDGFAGDFCEKRVESCADAPCAHGGVCTDTASSYSCACPLQYHGTNCSEDVDECSSTTSPCAHGTCTNTIGSFSCNCGNSGYQGATCNQLSATITPDATSHDFGVIEVGAVSATFTLTLTNHGDVSTGAITQTFSGGLALVSGSCAALEPHASCTLKLSLKVDVEGSVDAALTLKGATGGQVTFKASAIGGYWVRINRPGTAAGRVTSSPAGIDCAAANAPGCSALLPPGEITLSARTTNGSDSFFSGFSGGSCKGPARDCVVTQPAPMITATFSPMTRNLIFATSQEFPADLGLTNSLGARAFDAKCNEAASAAGLNDAGGKAFIAFVSDSASLARSRLGNARGWVRLDGLPVGDTQAALFDSKQIFNPVSFDETGAYALYSTFSGSSSDGALKENCNGWTTKNSTYNEGAMGTGPELWAGNFFGGSDCQYARHLLCMGITKTAPAPAVVTTGKKIWVTNTLLRMDDGITPDQKCQAERPSGVTTAKALIAYVGKAASDLLDRQANYVRPDGTLVGTGDALYHPGDLQSGIWQAADGTYGFNNRYDVWTGSETIRSLGTAATTCGDWKDVTQKTIVGYCPYTYDHIMWAALSNVSCDSTAFHLYCIQTAP